MFTLRRSYWPGQCKSHGKNTENGIIIFLRASGGTSQGNDQVQNGMGCAEIRNLEKCFNPAKRACGDYQEI